MGEFYPAKFAFMVPTHRGQIMEDNILEPHLIIYKINSEDIPAFQALWGGNGVDFKVITSVHDFTDSLRLKNWKPEIE
jgi:hypothetical protein